MDRPFYSPSRVSDDGTSPFVLVLMVEDNLADALLMREAIQTEGLPVDLYLAKDGEEAASFIERAESQPGAPCPQAMLLDLNLPKMDGFQILRRVRASKTCNHIPVLVVTSSASPADRQKAAELGAAYFRKPADYDGFLKVGGLIRQLLQQHQLLPL